jgi:PilZ domain
MPGDVEKRKSVRVPVRFDTRQIKDQVELVGTALNLSLEGIFIQVPLPLIPFETWDIQFQLPGAANAMKVKAHVIWSARVDVSGSTFHGAGFHFEQIAVAQTNELKRFIQRLLQP